MSSWWDAMVFIREWRLRDSGSDDIVFHARGREQHGHIYPDAEGNNGYGLETHSVCGLLVDHWQGGVDRAQYVMFRDTVAEKIARPCKRCYEVTDG